MWNKFIILCEVNNERLEARNSSIKSEGKTPAEVLLQEAYIFI
jgi:hypothetical protein